MNKLFIVGNLTRDPELRTTQSGVSVASFTVACEQDYQHVTDFIDCVAWRQKGEFVSKYFRKGGMIVVDGRLQSRKWEDRDGNKRTSWEVNADHVYFGESRREDEGRRSRDDYEDNGPRQRGDAYDGYGGNGGRPVNVAPPMFEDLGDGELPF